MTDKKLTDDRLRTLIGTYGADPLNYPSDERDAAKARLQETPDAFLRELADARAVDSALDSLPDIQVPAALRAALIAGAPSAPRKRGLNFGGFKLPVWAPAGALASLAIGMLVGLNIGTQADYSVEDEAVEAYVFAALGYDTYDLTEDGE